MQGKMTVAVDGAAHEMDITRLTFAEARAIEKVTGQRFADALTNPSIDAVQALIWVCLKRGEPTLKFADLDDRAISDFDLEIDKAEPEIDKAEPDGIVADGIVADGTPTWPTLDPTPASAA